MIYQGTPEAARAIEVRQAITDELVEMIRSSDIPEHNRDAVFRDCLTDALGRLQLKYWPYTTKVR